MPEDLFKMFQLEQGRYVEQAFFMETSVGAKYVQMRMPSKEIAKRVSWHDGPWYCLLFRNGFLKNLQ